ncbi:MAG: M60 family metallopeptidase [Clostridia bacterium]|nr:M60 family metallopeptidase [Clostridia bacterium]
MAEKETNTPKTSAKPEKVNKEKTAKAAKTEEGGGSAFKAKVAAIVRTDNFKIFGIIALSLILVLCLSLGLVFGLKNDSLDDGLGGNPLDKIYEDFGELTVTSVSNSHNNKTQVGFSGEIVGTVQRNKPVEEIQDGGLVSNGTIPNYPKYGSTAKYSTEQKTAVISESRKLTANGTWIDVSKKTSGSYDKMDENGYLYKTDGTKPGNGVPERLYKHTASVGLYGGNVADDEPAVVKNLTFRPRSYGSYYNVTGLYAPAGEVIKIQLTNADMEATSGLTIHIGQALYNGQANNIWEQRGVNRMPVILNTMNITKQTATYDEATGLWTGYVGSFLGGPIYVRNESSTFSVTISGGVNYAHFILGVTTEEEYNVYKQSSAPYFDLEVWDRGVLHSGPKRKANGFSYDDLYKAAILWEKVSLVSTTNGTNQGVVFLYDPFVAAGAAVAFPGRRSVNCPEGWLTSSLNYKSFVTSGSWGNMHEYNHNFQNYGLGSGADGEVTNNGLNLVSYSLYTKISSSRQIGGYGGAGLSGWNQYTSATWVTQRVNNNAIGSTNGLAIYATLLHNFGQDQYLKARGSSGKNNYLNKWATNTHQDMSYFASKISSYGGGTYTPSTAVANANYPLFVPVASVYQTGRTYMYDNEKREINTMQPYVIPYGKSFKVDLNEYKVNDAGQYQSGSVVIGNGFSFKIKSVNTDGVNGTFVKSGEEGVYTFTPNSELRSGKIRVTLEIFYGEAKDGVREYNGHALQDVDLLLEFQQSHEGNKNVLERTIYTFDDKKYSSATEAYEKGYEGYTGVETKDNKNYSQNSNTDIWLYPLRYTDDATYGQYVYTPNSVLELKGKLYFPEEGKYRIYMRGRSDCALYVSRDNGNTYSLAAHIDRNDNLGTSAVFFPNNEKTYFDVDVEAEEWVYFKEVLIVEPMPNSNNMVSFVGLGLAQWTTPMYTSEVTYHTVIDGNRTNLTEEITADGSRYYYTVSNIRHYVESDGTRYYYNADEKIDESKVGAVESETVYKNASGQTVSAEEASNTDPIPPASNVTPTYATAYRQSYEFQKEFESDYFFTRSYNYNYVGDPEKYSTWDEGVSIVSCNKADGGAAYKIDNILKEGMDTYFHSASNANYSAGALVLELDMGKQIAANGITFLGRSDKAATTAMQGLPNKFSLEVSDDGVNYTSAGEYENSGIRNNTQVTVALDKAYEFRYVKITINSTWSNNKHFIYSGIYFTYTFQLTGNGSNHITPDDARFTYTGTWKLAQTLSTFGHVYLGESGSQTSFEYDAKEGGRFGILSSNRYGQNYEVYIDGNKVDSVKVKEDSNEFAIRYLTPKLSAGKHQIVIKCVGEANIDSIVFY